jgi:hypothetical protein
MVGRTDQVPLCIAKWLDEAGGRAYRSATRKGVAGADINLAPFVRGMDQATAASGIGFARRDRTVIASNAAAIPIADDAA